MRDYFTVKINLPAGIVSPASLQKVLKLAYEARVRQVRFGSRQQLLISVHGEEMRPFEKALKREDINYEVDTDNHPNIISSYCGEAVFRTGDWLGESEYHTILDQFDHRPRLKVNLSDASQSFTPFFTGNLNFIASPEPHFWYLYIRTKQSNTLFRWRDLVYTNDVARLARAVEEALLASMDEPASEVALYQAVMAGRQFITQPATQEVDLPDFTLPYYEGFNRYGERTWLGIYRRDELFPINFLLDACALCLKTRIGEICVTPWKSLVIKGINSSDRAAWSHILATHNINVRHAANELAWQTEDHTDEGTRLKKYVVRFFEKHDTRTFGLCFGIQTRAKSEVFGSVLVRRRALIRFGQLSVFSVYDLYFAENFNPNSRRYTLFERGIFKLHLPARIERLCQQYNTRRLEVNGLHSEPIDPTATETTAVPVVHQCPACFTVYDPAYGDHRQGIAAGTSFDLLPPSYQCATCDEPKVSFVPFAIPEAILSGH